MLEGFKVLTLVAGLPTMSVTKNGVAFNKSTIIKMQKCAKVLVLLDESGKRFAIQTARDEDENSTPFYVGQKNNNVRWNNSDLLKQIEKIMSWNLSECGYKTTGDVIEDESAIVFDLNTAEPI